MLLPLFEWLENTRVALAMRHSLLLFAVFDTIHQLGMMVLLGTIIVVSLRLLGVVMPRRPVTEIAGQLRRWTVAGLVTNLATGPFLVVPESVRWYHSGPFQLKMSVLFVATVFHFTLYRKVTSGDEAGPVLRGVTGTLALLLWFGVGWMGRLITVFG